MSPPDELPEFIDWALSGEGRERNYGCFALDSWASYFSAKHSETIAAVRARTDDQLAQPSAEELAAAERVLNVARDALIIANKASVSGPSGQAVPAPVSPPGTPR